MRLTTLLQSHHGVKLHAFQNIFTADECILPVSVRKVLMGVFTILDVITCSMSDTHPMYLLRINNVAVCSFQRTRIVQGDQKVCVHLMITVQKHAKIFLTVSITYHNNVVRITDNRWR
jgi:hypothetical protein